MIQQGHDDARIFDQGYRPFEGQLASVSTRFWVITANELRHALREKWFRRLLWASFMPLIVFAVLVVVRSRFAQLFDNADFEIWMPFWGMQLFFAMIAVFFIGRRAIGEDLRSRALDVYFSRPVSFFQYLFGKWLAVALGVVGVTLLPGLVLALFRWLAEPDTHIADFAAWSASFLVLAALLALSMGWIMLAVSSLATRGRAAGIVWVALFFLSAGLAEALVHATGFSQFDALGFSKSNTALAEFLFKGTGSIDLAAVWIGGQLVWAAAAFGLVLLRLRRWARV
jgi:ABC-type transport system involved in multi-copper enzyme maturation permease subunit